MTHVLVHNTKTPLWGRSTGINFIRKTVLVRVFVLYWVIAANCRLNAYNPYISHFALQCFELLNPINSCQNLVNYLDAFTICLIGQLENGMLEKPPRPFLLAWLNICSIRASLSLNWHSKSVASLKCHIKMIKLLCYPVDFCMCRRFHGYDPQSL